MARLDLHLVVTVFDSRKYSAVEEVFTKFPVSVGRAGGNNLRLDARSVSRQHGAFTYEPGSLLGYMDMDSRYGTHVDGVRIEPRTVVRLRDSTILSIGPYQLSFHLRRGCPRPQVTVPVTVPLLGPPEVSLWKESLARSEAIRRVRADHGPSDLLRRAAEVIEVLAESIVLFRRDIAMGRSFLRSTAAPDEVAAYLLSPANGERALRELRDVLTELFMTSPPREVRS
jgi:hypothetical protein